MAFGSYRPKTLKNGYFGPKWPNFGLKVVATSQNAPQFYFRNQYLLVFQAYCKNPHVLNLFYSRVIEPQSSIIRPSYGDKSYSRYPAYYVTSISPETRANLEWRSRHCLSGLPLYKNAHLAVSTSTRLFTF